MVKEVQGMCKVVGPYVYGMGKEKDVCATRNHNVVQKYVISKFVNSFL